MQPQHFLGINSIINKNKSEVRRVAARNPSKSNQLKRRPSMDILSDLAEWCKNNPLDTSNLSLKPVYPMYKEMSETEIKEHNEKQRQSYIKRGISRESRVCRKEGCNKRSLLGKDWCSRVHMRQSM